MRKYLGVQQLSNVVLRSCIVVRLFFSGLYMPFSFGKHSDLYVAANFGAIEEKRSQLTVYRQLAQKQGHTKLPMSIAEL